MGMLSYIYFAGGGVLEFRTDMASEAHRLWRQAADEITELRGVRAREQTLCGLAVTAVEILDDEGAESLKKPRGKYYTLELPKRFERGAEDFASAAQAAAGLLRRCIGGSPERVLVAALGNPDITPDALGSIAASYVLVTKHLKERAPADFSGFCSLALCRTGVLGTAGFESAEHIAALCGRLRPELVIVVDALAGADAGRLCRTVQFTDAGIAPGSGVGNDRGALSRAALGVPVAAVGVPTVIDAQFFGGPEKMFVTPRDIDSAVRAAGRVIGYGIDLAVHRGITLDDIDMLIG